MVVEIRDWCQNVGEYNTYNFCIWHFGLCVIVSKIDRCRSSDPPYEIAINPIFRSYRVSDVIITSPPIGGGRGIVMPMSVCLFVCVFVCVCVCVFVCLFVRVFAKFQSVISQPFLNRSL